MYELGFDPSNGDRQLFLDDRGIQHSEHLTRSMHLPDKKGAVIRPRLGVDPPCLQIRTAPIWDPERERFRFWGGGSVRESDDGLNWSIVAPYSGPSPVVYDRGDPDATRRYKAFSPGQRAVSPDGANWKTLDLPPVPSGDEFNFSFDERNRLFIATVKHAGPHGRAVWLSTSEDFDTWTEPELMFHADEVDQLMGQERIRERFSDPNLASPYFDFPPSYNVDIYNMAAFRYESAYLGFPMMYHQTGKVSGSWPDFANWELSEEMRTIFQRDGDWAGFHHVQLAWSRDLREWARPSAREPFIDLSPLGGGDLDYTSVTGPSFPLVRGDELWLYYTGGRQYGGPEPNRGVDQEMCGTCLATIRRDGFVSLDAGVDEGVLTTEPFRFTGERLFVNVKAPAGQVRAEIIESNGSVVRASEPLSGDLPSAAFSWRQGDLGGVENQEVALRLTAHRAQLFSYWIA
jgi:hypothetical protein